MSAAAVALNSKNQLEVYAIAANGNVYGLVQAGPADWSNQYWFSLQALGTAPTIVSSLAVSNNPASNCLEVFGIGTEAGEDETLALWHIVQSAASSWTNSEWASLGGSHISAPCVAGLTP